MNFSTNYFLKQYKILEVIKNGSSLASLPDLASKMKERENACELLI